MIKWYQPQPQKLRLDWDWIQAARTTWDVTGQRELPNCSLCFSSIRNIRRLVTTTSCASLVEFNLNGFYTSGSEREREGKAALWYFYNFTWNKQKVLTSMSPTFLLYCTVLYCSVVLSTPQLHRTVLDASKCHKSVSSWKKPAVCLWCSHSSKH